MVSDELVEEVVKKAMSTTRNKRPSQKQSQKKKLNDKPSSSTSDTTNPGDIEETTVVPMQDSKGMKTTGEHQSSPFCNIFSECNRVDDIIDCNEHPFYYYDSSDESSSSCNSNSGWLPISNTYDSFSEDDDETVRTYDTRTRVEKIAVEVLAKMSLSEQQGRQDKDAAHSERSFFSILRRKRKQKILKDKESEVQESPSFKKTTKRRLFLGRKKHNVSERSLVSVNCSPTTRELKPPGQPKETPKALTPTEC